MKVNASGTGAVQNSETQGANSTRRTGKAATGDAGKISDRSGTHATPDSVRAEISSRARDMATAKAAANGAPDVREDKIAELKRRIEAGKYQVDADAVSDRLVDEHLHTSGMG